MDLRQVALVATQLAPVRRQIFALLGLDEDFDDTGVAEFGLHNSVMAVGDTFLEVVAPLREETTAGRLLSRRGGDGGYMVLVQVEDIAFYQSLADRIGLRKIWETDRPEVRAFHVHPKDIGAAIVSFDQMVPASEWIWAGPGWREHRARHVNAITAVDIQGADPASLAERWAQALDRPLIRDGSSYVIQLDTGVVNVVEATDGRGDGVCGIEFRTVDMDAVLGQAAALGLPVVAQVAQEVAQEVVVCGTRFRFREG